MLSSVGPTTHHRYALNSLEENHQVKTQGSVLDAIKVVPEFLFSILEGVPVFIGDLSH